MNAPRYETPELFEQGSAIELTKIGELWPSGDFITGHRGWLPQPDRLQDEEE